MSNQEQQDLQVQGVPQDSDAYINFYGLTGDPFRPDSPLFFSTPQLEKLLRLFNYLARFSRKLVLVTGDSGAGKTTLLENFVNQQDEQDLVCFFAALTTDTPQQALYEIAGQLGIDSAAGSESFEQLIKEIRDYSLQRLDQGKNCIVIIDDAHLFDQAVLEQLYQLTLDEPEQRCAIRLLLCGQASLLELMRGVVPAEVVAKTLFHQQISPFSYDEVVQYLIVHFKENAGHSKPPFSENDYRQIYQQSEGLPGRVNELAKLALTEGVSRLVARAEGGKKSQGFMALLAVILLAVGGALWWQNGQQEANNTDVAQLGVTGQIDRAEEMPKVGENELASEQIFADPEISSKPEQSKSLADAGPVEPVFELESNKNQGITASLPIPGVPSANDDVLPKKSEEVAAPKAIIQAEESVVASMAEPEMALEQPPTGKQVAAEIKTAPKLIPEERQRQAIVAQPASRLRRDAERILAFDPSEYTMQLLGSYKEESIVAVLQKLPGDENLLFFKKTHKGEPWYVLIYGHYADRAAADSAAKKLPAALKGIKPWIRGVSGIQDTVKANQ